MARGGEEDLFLHADVPEESGPELPERRQIDPAGLALTCLMMYSVLPLSSAACTTSNVHSGCATTFRQRGCRSRGADLS